MISPHMHSYIYLPFILIPQCAISHSQGYFLDPIPHEDKKKKKLVGSAMILSQAPLQITTYSMC